MNNILKFTMIKPAFIFVQNSFSIGRCLSLVSWGAMRKSGERNILVSGAAALSAGPD